VAARLSGTASSRTGRCIAARRAPGKGRPRGGGPGRDGFCEIVEIGQALPCLTGRGSGTGVRDKPYLPVLVTAFCFLAPAVPCPAGRCSWPFSRCFPRSGATAGFWLPLFRRFRFSPVSGSVGGFVSRFRVLPVFRAGAGGFGHRFHVLSRRWCGVGNSSSVS